MSYTGPGDIATFKTWCGLRAFSAATCGTPCADIAVTSGGTTHTINSLANGNFDVASANTFLGGNTGFVAKLYDQTGNGFHQTQSTSTWQPVIVLNALQGATLPEMRFLPNTQFTDHFLLDDVNLNFTTTNPWSLGVFYKPIAYTSTRLIWGGDNTTGGGGSQGIAFTSATTVAFWTASFGGGPSPVTVSQNNYHSVIGWNVNGAGNGGLMVDGTTTTFTGTTNAWTTAGINIGDENGSYKMSVTEMFAVQGSVASNAAALDTNMRNYWLVASGGTTTPPWFPMSSDDQPSSGWRVY